jgi:PPOX class probable F420-dependent enzyme
MIPESHREILDKKGLATLGTLGPDGSPHCSPVWFDFNGDRIRFSLTEDRQKFRNLQRDDRVAVSFTDPDNNIHSFEVRGRVTFEPDPENAFINLLSAKYLGLPVYPMPDTAPRVIGSVQIEQLHTWM